MTDDFRGYDGWKTTPPEDETDRVPMHSVTCPKGHRWFTRLDELTERSCWSCRIDAVLEAEKSAALADRLLERRYGAQAATRERIAMMTMHHCGGSILHASHDG